MWERQNITTTQKVWTMTGDAVPFRVRIPCLGHVSKGACRAKPCATWITFCMPTYEVCCFLFDASAFCTSTTPKTEIKCLKILPKNTDKNGTQVSGPNHRLNSSSVSHSSSLDGWKCKSCRFDEARGGVGKGIGKSGCAASRHSQTITEDRGGHQKPQHHSSRPWQANQSNWRRRQSVMPNTRWPPIDYWTIARTSSSASSFPAQMELQVPYRRWGFLKR